MQNWIADQLVNNRLLMPAIADMKNKPSVTLGRALDLHAWHAREQARGALALIAGRRFPGHHRRLPRLVSEERPPTPLHAHRSRKAGLSPR